MKSINVNVPYLEDLRRRQEAARKDIGDATDDGFVGQIQRTHGLYVRAGVNKIVDAAGARKAAGDAVQERVKRIEDLLDEAKKQYTGTDDSSGRGLDTQMKTD